MAEIGDHVEIVLDHQHGAILGDRADEFRDRADILMAHAGHRLVEQQHLGIERQGGRDLQHALAAVGEIAGHLVARVVEADGLQQLLGARRQRVERRQRAPELHVQTLRPLQRDPHIVEHGEVRKDRGDLERTHQAHARHLGRRRGGDVLAEKFDPAGARRQELGEQVEDRGLAGAVRPDQRLDLAGIDVEVDAVDGDEAAEIAPQAAGGQHRPRILLLHRHHGACHFTSGQPLSAGLI